MADGDRKSPGQGCRPVDSWTRHGTVTGSPGALHNDWVTQRSAPLDGGRRCTPGRPTFRLSAALPAATDTEESRVHQPAFLSTHPVGGGRPEAPSPLRSSVCAGVR